MPDYTTATKRAWRERVWDSWRRMTGLRSISRDRQYWTLGHRVLDDAGNPTGELAAILQDGLLESPSSFWSVCDDEPTATQNLPPCLCGAPATEHQGMDHAYVSSAPWNAVWGRMEEVVPRVAQAHNFQPALVNLDTTHYPERAWRLAGQVGRLCPAGTIMALNMVDDYMYRRVAEQTVKTTPSHPWFERVRVHDPGIRYHSGRCWLTTVMLEWGGYG